AWKGKLRQVSRLVERENPRSDLWNPHLQRKQRGEDVNEEIVPLSRVGNKYFHAYSYFQVNRPRGRGTALLCPYDRCGSNT
ncbi:hypothetical protein, partial [Nostoc sp.]